MEPYKHPLEVSSAYTRFLKRREHRRKCRIALSLAFSGALLVLLGCLGGAAALPILAASLWTLGAALASAYHLCNL